jgi:AcrR family transcriptional regulator
MRYTFDRGDAVPRASEQTRQRILDAAYALFRRGGYTRVSMDEIAAAAGVTKRTLYYHFESKDALLATVLEAQHRLALAAFRTFGDKLSGHPEAMIDTLFRDLAVWSDKPRWAGSGFTRLVIELADLPGHPARMIARRHKADPGPPRPQLCGGGRTGGKEAHSLSDRTKKSDSPDRWNPKVTAVRRVARSFQPDADTRELPRVQLHLNADCSPGPVPLRVIVDVLAMSPQCLLCPR